jgi:ribosomal protein L16/L10AE
MTATSKLNHQIERKQIEHARQTIDERLHTTRQAFYVRIFDRDQ